MTTTLVPSQYVLPDGAVLSTETIDEIRNSLRVLGRGASRRAYEISDKAVLKVDTGETWAGNCRSEILAYLKLSTSEVAPYLAPILAGDPDAGWLVMARAATTNSDGRFAVNHLPNAALNSHGIRDLHAANVGWITTDTGEEVPVVIDYAFNGESRGAGCEYSDDDSYEDSTECNAGTRTRNHNAGTTCGHGSCEDCHGEQTVRHNAGTTCCQTDCEMCYPYGRYCEGREDCYDHPENHVEMPNGDRIGLCLDCQPNAAFYRYVPGPTFRAMHPQLPGFVVWGIVQRRTDKGAGISTSLRGAALLAPRI